MDINGGRMITIKLTRKEAEALRQGVICSELEREGCPEQYDEIMGKNFHKILDSACTKLTKALGDEIKKEEV